MKPDLELETNQNKLRINFQKTTMEDIQKKLLEERWRKDNGIFTGSHYNKHNIASNIICLVKSSAESELQTFIE